MRKAKIRPPLTLGARADLIEAHLYRVPLLADRMKHRLPWVEKAELIGVGNLRLVQCAARFEEARGVPFGFFASLNIQGAILDWCRREDLLSRDERSNGDVWERSRVDLSFANRTQSRQGRQSEIETNCDLEVLLARVPARDRYAVEQYFLVGRTLSDIAGELHIRSSRASELIHLAIETMRAEVYP